MDNAAIFSSSNNYWSQDHALQRNDPQVVQAQESMQYAMSRTLHNPLRGVESATSKPTTPTSSNTPQQVHAYFPSPSVSPAPITTSNKQPILDLSEQSPAPTTSTHAPPTIIDLNGLSSTAWQPPTSRYRYSASNNSTSTTTLLHQQHLNDTANGDIVSSLVDKTIDLLSAHHLKHPDARQTLNQYFTECMCNYMHLVV